MSLPRSAILKNIRMAEEPLQRIESRQNPRVKNLVRLRENTHRRRQQLFLVEGARELGRALAAQAPIEEIFLCPEFIHSNEARELLPGLRTSGLPITELAPGAFEKVSYRDSPDGLLATVRQWPAGLEALTPPADALVLVLESLEKPGNLGAILRTADAAGAHAVIVADAITDPFNPNVVRASQGALFNVPVAVADTPSTLAWLREQGMNIFATTPDTSSTLWDADLRGPSAVVLGSEAYGLSPAWLDAAGVSKIRIPMADSATDSLNVSNAASVCLFEAIRQRLTCRSGLPRPGRE